MLPWYLDVLSRLAPLRYAVDLTRCVYNAGSLEAARVVLAPVAVNLLAVGAMFVAFLVVGSGRRCSCGGNATGQRGC